MSQPVELNPRAGRIATRLRCPACRLDQGLLIEPDGLLCSACHARYRVERGLPILLNGSGAQMREAELGTDTGAAMVREYAQAGAAATGPVRRGWRPPQLIWDDNPDMKAGFVRRIFDHAGPATVVLNVGGGPRRYGANDVNLNISGFHNVDLIADAHDIPLLSNSVDSIVCNAVLEHVRYPERVVEEMVRVLKPGGLLYAEVPFIFFFHGYPSDYRRYTYEGMRLLFGALGELEVSLSGGPMSALLQTANIVFEDMLPAQPRIVRKAFNGAFRLFTFPLKYLDRMWRDKPQAPRVACGYRVLGRKPAAAGAGDA
jgi:SAM-dependent methyltransferase